ncbi:MAG: spherulation-specific family 4 protein [Planctomycetota bacterium]
MKRLSLVTAVVRLVVIVGFLALFAVPPGCNSGQGSGSGGGGGSSPPPPPGPPAPPPTPPTPPPPPPPPPAPPATATVLVPLYTSPGPEWDKVVQAKLNHPQTTVEVVINVQSGPGSSASSIYDTGVRALRNAGVRVLGYVDTARGARPAADAKTDILRWQQFYAVDGIFLDLMPRTTGAEAYYSDLTSFAKAYGMNRVVGDPGGEVPQSYATTVDTLVIYEAEGMPTPTALTASWHANAERSSLAYIALAVPTLDAAAVRATRPIVGTLYVTSYAAPQAFFFVPSYLDDLVAAASN